jgi:DNA-binding response OmpR family regulator
MPMSSRRERVANRVRPARSASAAVLIVTADGHLAEACASVLEKEGFGVLHARHSGHALLACLSGRPTDILIAELSMDDGSGPALTDRLRRYSPNLQAVYLANPGTSYEAGNVLVRPFTCADLIARVRGCLISSQAS